MTFPALDLQALLDAIVAFLPRLGLALLVYLIARVISSWATRLLRRRLTGQKADEELIILLEMFTRWGIQGLGIVLALEQLAPGRLSALLAGLGIAGVTIGFALQDVAKNFIAGILLLLTQPFEIGDTIEVQGYAGKVLAINLRSTEMRESDGRFVIIPNSDIFISPIINFTPPPAGGYAFRWVSPSTPTLTWPHEHFLTPWGRSVVSWRILHPSSSSKASMIR
jgi:small-conductance mechanosensitive channel